ncbi:hypothetical protein [Nocardioides sp.]|uniref:hypothetical protein n=1 Tax=Nocardioides sp. TaxID=35761 RepID=UPI00271E8CA9|nr:hypothetical protein [Nocardioides sp.]MDO9455215.1 hypothetical protein [Nocardioides sp.]
MSTTLAPQTLPVNVDRSHRDVLDALAATGFILDVLDDYDASKAKQSAEPPAAQTVSRARRNQLSRIATLVTGSAATDEQRLEYLAYLADLGHGSPVASDGDLR